MLSYNLLKKHAGLLLIGDYTTLSLLRETLLDVASRAPELQGKDAFLSLAYDARKAYEKKRQILQPPEALPELGVRYGVEVYWPSLLVISRLLRRSLAYIDHSKHHQTITYALEAVIEDGLKDDFGLNAPEVIDMWRWIDDPSLLDRLDEILEKFISWGARERKNQLVSLLRTSPSWMRDFEEDKNEPVTKVVN
ncbi:MAG: hypothetical protein NC112_09145 [Oxalobacter formigenes]|nr:hypothetical protein [Oxalobacter formigenes]